MQQVLIEGADASGASDTPTTRVGNRTQIQGKTVHISGTLDAVDKAGRKTETAYQLAKAGQELKRDMEKTILGNVAQVMVLLVQQLDYLALFNHGLVLTL